MLSGSGKVLEVSESRTKPFGRVLRDYASKGFTGYVNYRNVNQGVYVTIAMVEGRVVACRAVGMVAVIFSPVERGVLYEGVECSRVAEKYLYVPDGIVEVIEVPRDLVLLDTLIFPLARIEERTPLEASLATEAVAGVREVAQPVLTPQPQLPPQERVPAPPGVPPAEAVPKPEVRPRGPELRLLDECIDPLTLYTVLRSSQLLESVRGAVNPGSLLEKLREVVSRGGVSYVYATGALKEGAIRLLYELSTSTVKVEVERGGRTLCGGEAMKAIEDEEISSVRVWVAQV